MSYSAKQWRVIRWYSKRNDLRPQLSAWPNVRFLTKDDKYVEHHIASLTDQYDAHLKQGSMARSRARKQKLAPDIDSKHGHAYGQDDEWPAITLDQQ